MKKTKQEVLVLETIYKTKDGCYFNNVESAKRHEKDLDEREAKAKERKEKERKDYEEIKTMYSTLCDMIDSYVETYGSIRLRTLF